MQRPSKGGGMVKKVMIAAPRNLISEGVALRIATEVAFGLVQWEEHPEGVESTYAKHQPDCLMMCINLYPEQPGMRLRRFMDNYPDANVLMVSGKSERDLIVEMMESKAKGFITATHINHQEMLTAIRCVAEGKTYLCQKSTEVLLGGLFAAVTKDNHTEVLSHREKEVVRYISDGQSSKEIARLMAISPATVEVHRRNIMRKLDIHKAAELTKYAIRSNLIAA